MIGGQASVACVGIFWGFKDSAGYHFAADATEIGAAEVYGDFLKHPKGHHEVWEAWRSFGSVRLKKLGLPVEILSSEYESVPRRRIVFDKIKQSYIIYADRKLQRASAIEQIVEIFRLAGQRYVVRSDGHYVS